MRDQEHPACTRSSRDPLQLGGHGRLVGVTSAFGLDELPDHHLCGLQPGHLGIDLGELLTQPLGAIGQHHPSLHHPHQYIRHQQPSRARSLGSLRRSQNPAPQFQRITNAPDDHLLEIRHPTSRSTPSTTHASPATCNFRLKTSQWWRVLQRFTGRRELLPETINAIAGLVSDKSAGLTW
ncbi:hypothetical protein ACH4S9_15255 [Streptomyces sp. NPDC021225]|uniref:hypothetical protein n=1 Tax=Streptomyces sp. NPDC021225 TaxID=3365121 RepID=UPI00379E316F